MIESRRFPPLRIVLVALAVVGAACRPRVTPTSGSEQSRPHANVSAYDDGASPERLTARVVCAADALEPTTWFDVVVFGTGAGAHRLCDATVRDLTGNPACRGVRACMEQPLGPAPEVRSTTAILRHTMPAPGLTVLLDEVEQGRPPDEVTGQVHEHVAFATRDECVQHSGARARRVRETEERDARQWIEGQLEGFERQRREAGEQLAELERRSGGPVAGRTDKLLAELKRARHPAERKRIEREVVEANLVEMEDRHLRQTLTQCEKLIEALRAPRSPSAPTETFSCFAPRGRQPALNTAK